MKRRREYGAATHARVLRVATTIFFTLTIGRCYLVNLCYGKSIEAQERFYHLTPLNFSGPTLSGVIWLVEKLLDKLPDMLLDERGQSLRILLVMDELHLLQQVGMRDHRLATDDIAGSNPIPILFGFDDHVREAICHLLLRSYCVDSRIPNQRWFGRTPLRAVTSNPSISGIEA